MTQSTTVSESVTFSLTHAKHIAAKVATDLKRMQRFYNAPSDKSIAEYETEVIQLLKHGYLHEVTYGFRRDGAWIEPTLRYSASDLSGTMADDDPGRIRPGASIVGASFYSYLTYKPAWNALSVAQQVSFKKDLPFQRGGAPEPSVHGYLETDLTYSAGGRALKRGSVRSPR